MPKVLPLIPFFVSTIGLVLGGTSVQAASSNDSAVWPSGCFALARPQEELIISAGIPDWAKTNYSASRVAVKRDIVCIADEINIDAPIYTNGGDLYIIAGRLTLSSMIDTKVYREFSFEQFFGNPTLGPPFPGGSNRYNYHNALDLLRSGTEPFTKNILSSFMEYYSSDDLRDFAGKKVIARSYDGLTPPMANRAATTTPNEFPITLQDGSNAPDDAVNFKNLKSGSVFLYTTALTIAPESGHIDVSGVSGGIGGAGQPPGCIGSVWELDRTISCVEGYDQSGVSGRGGQGGAAGNIELILTRRADAMTLDDLARTNHASPLNLTGGFHGRNTKLRSPSDLNKNIAGYGPLAGHMSDFRNEGTWPVALDGTDGKLSVEVVLPSRMWSRFYNEIHSLDTSRFYDLADLARQAEGDRSKDSLSYTDYLTSFLYRKLQDRYLNVLDATQSMLIGHSIRPEPLIDQLHLCSLDASASDAWSTQVRVILEFYHTTCLRDGGTPSAEKYFGQNGGLLNVKNAEALQAARSDLVSLSISENEETWEKVEETLSSINEKVIDLYVLAGRNRLEGNINDLKQRLVKLQAAINALSGPPAPRPLEVFKLFITLYTGIGDYQSALNLFDGTPDGEHGVGSVIDAAETVQQDWSDFQSEVDSAKSDLSNFPGPRAQADAVVVQIDEANRDLKKFLDAMGELKAQAIESKALALIRTMEVRARYGRRLRARLGLFEDLYRLVLISYIVDPASSKSLLQRNIDGLKTYLQGYPSFQPDVSLFSFDTSCNYAIQAIPRPDHKESLASCINVERRKSVQVLKLKPRYAQTGADTLPLYVIEPGLGGVTLPLFRLPLSNLRIEP